MLVKLNQLDGHVRTYEVRTIHHDGERRYHGKQEA